ncbi:NAD(P)-binding domain-containing protein, partial [Streptomyces sp. ActVer]|uniref:NAD(P)-binding domain-containing protein n=1 Tax=Streptomyces sp. ActVer TaxID=3014558 RepID=UPI0022B4C214
MQILVIGATGYAGRRVSAALARAGHTARAWTRSRDKAEPLPADGAHVVDTPAEALERADVVLTMLYDGP